MTNAEKPALKSKWLVFIEYNPFRAKMRGKSYPGIMNAMAVQYSKYLIGRLQSKDHLTKE